MMDAAADYVIGVIVLVAWVLGITAISVANLTRSAVRALQEEIAGLKQELAAVTAVTGAPAKVVKRAAKRRAETGTTAPAADATTDIEDNAADARAAGAVKSSPPRPAKSALAAVAGIEERLTSRWLVWLGGIALALGGAFLVKVSIDQGWFTPAVRVLLGLVLAALLIGAGERLRRHPLRFADTGSDATYLPAAMTGAGLFTAFGSLYAAYALYELIPSVFAFVLLAGVAGGAIALSLLQGPFIAVLGVIGAYVVPALIETATPSVWSLFPYLMIVALGGIGLMWFRPWWWLSAFNLLGATVWAMMWLATHWQPGDGLAIGVYLISLLGLFYMMRRERDGEAASANENDWLVFPLRLPDQLFAAAACVVAVLIFVLVRSDGYSAVSLLTLAAFAALCITAARREPDFDLLPAVAAAPVIVLVALWHTPYLLAPRIIDGVSVGPVVPPDQIWLVLVTAAFGVLFGVGGFVAGFTAKRPGLWAALAVTVPVLLFFTLYGLLEDFVRNWRWAGYSMLLAPFYLIAAWRVARVRERQDMEPALGIYAVGVTSTVSLAIAVSLFQVWLTVALALQTVAIAWVYGRMRIEALRAPAYLLAGAVVVRLLLNPKIFVYPMGDIPILNWVLYGYGGSTLAFLTAARLFRKAGSLTLTYVLQASALVLFLAMIGLEIHSVLGETLALGRAEYDLLEQSLQTATWAAMALALLIANGRMPHPVAFWGWRILGGLAAAHILVMQMLTTNPLITGTAVGEMPIANLLLLAYAVPAVLAAAIYRNALVQGETVASRIAGIVSLLLSFIWLSLEVRHGFHGSALRVGATGDPEWYTYSVAWLVYAGGLLALGIWRQSAGLRWASLVVTMLTVAKVFLFDIAALHGIYGALSLLGLGGSLVGIGYFYQRFVFPPRAVNDSGA